LNDRVCPIVRYTYNSIVFVPLNFLLGGFFFDAQPDGNNCADPGFWWTCFWLNFGTLYMYVLAPLHIIIALFPALKKAGQDIWQWLRLLLGVVISLVVRILHRLHKQAAAAKKID
jgi:hypothetical protein